MVDQIKATDLFSNWAKEGKDQRMANTHAPSVQEMLDHILPSISTPLDNSLLAAPVSNNACEIK